MTKSPADLLAAELRERAEDYRSRAPDHPALDRLIAYHEGRLTPDEEDRLQAHLVGCRDCTALLLELESFLARSEGPAEGGADFETAAAWRALQARLPKQSPTKPVWKALAATLCAVTIGLSIWVGRQQSRLHGLEEEVARLSQPRQTAILDLSEVPLVRGEALTETLRLEPTSELVTLVVAADAGALAEYPAFGLRLIDGRGAELWSFDRLTPGRRGTFELSVPRRLLPDGAYGLVLSGLRGDRERPLRQYRIVVETRR